MIAVVIGAFMIGQHSENNVVNEASKPYSLETKVASTAPLPSPESPDGQQARVVERSSVIEQPAYNPATNTLTTTQTSEYIPMATPNTVPLVAQGMAPMAPMRVQTVTTTAPAPTRIHTRSRVVHRAVIRKHHSSGKVHVIRAVKHATLFSAKLPFKLRP